MVKRHMNLNVGCAPHCAEIDSDIQHKLLIGHVLKPFNVKTLHGAQRGACNDEENKHQIIIMHTPHRAEI